MYRTQPRLQLEAEIATFLVIPANHLSRQGVSGRKNSILSKAKWFTLISRHPKMHWAQPHLKLGAEVPIFSENPATNSSKQAVSDNKAVSSLKVKLFDLISRHRKYIGLDPNFNLGTMQLVFQKIQSTPLPYLERQFLVMKQHSLQMQSWLL